MEIPGVGDAAPQFTLASDSGEPVSLHQFAGKWVVLYFYPRDNTPGCTAEACDMRDLHSEFIGADAVILGVSKDSLASHRKFRDNHSLPFMLLSDPDATVAQLYGVWKEKSRFGRKYMGMERTTFIIDPVGRIAGAFPKVTVRGHAYAVLDRLRQLQQGA